ncbi:MAG: N-acetylmuramoyl-L-alanine amidase [Eggerthellaceae bacterium]
MKDWEKCVADVDKIMNKHFTSGRNGSKIQHVVIHYNAGDLTVERCWQVWQTRAASAHYQVESSGRIGQLVWDRDTAWHAGNATENRRSIGIEHANRKDGTISEACLDNGAHLVAALCRLYGLGRPEWGVNVFPHKRFSATSCPGQIYGTQKDTYIQRAQSWYDQMGGKASGSSAGKTDASTSSSSPYTVKVTADALNVRKGPGTSYEKTGCIRDKGTYTIVKESNGWGRLKSGLGWISLAYTARSSSSTSAKKSVDEVAREVVAGRWGNGTARREALQKAGYDYGTVQKRVNELLK